MSVSRQHRARITLPRLSGAEALLVVQVLERIVRLIWRAYGEEMADAIGRDHPAPETLCDCSCVIDSPKSPTRGDDDIPF